MPFETVLAEQEHAPTLQASQTALLSIIKKLKIEGRPALGSAVRPGQEAAGTGA